MFATFVLLSILFTGSLIVWAHLVKQWRRHLPALAMNDHPRATWRSAAELAVAYVALVYAVSHLLALFASSESAQPTTVDRTVVATQVVLNFGLSFILTLVLVSNRRPIEFGMTLSQWRDQLRIGVQGFLAAVLPMTLSMAATVPLRGEESQHALLKLLMESADPITVILVALLAAVSVPLLEELLFRVILQDWLAAFLPARVAIPIIAVLFALVHGWRNGLALLPLAFILGYVFYRRHSYLAVVVIHALFNATMLTLQLLIPPTPK